MDNFKRRSNFKLNSSPELRVRVRMMYKVKFPNKLKGVQIMLQFITIIINGNHVHIFAWWYLISHLLLWANDQFVRIGLEVY